MSNRRKIKGGKDCRTKVEVVNGNRGYASNPDVGVITFEVQGIGDRDNIIFAQSRNIYSRYISDRMTLNLSGFTVPLWGEGHNLYPQEVYAGISENKLLPTVINKLVKFIFGKGPRLYKEMVVGEGTDQKRVRIPYEDKAIQDWLDSWEERGYPHCWEYLKNIINDFYHVKTCVSKYHFARSRRTGGLIPIEALTYVGSDEARLAATNIKHNQRIKNEDCKYVIVGDWMNISGTDYDVYNRFSPKEPFKFPSAIAFNSDKTFTKWTYAFNDWFAGLQEYLKACKLAPMYRNSYLKNALNNHVHAVIPGTWYEHHKEILESICESNIQGDEDTPIQSRYRGVKLVDDDGKPFRFYEGMMDELISAELRNITEVMTGEGKNQGKLYATLKWGEEGWEFKDFPGKFKEFFDAVDKYDESSIKSILMSLGISASITNVDNSGLTSKSGNEVWYNYLMYVMTLTLDEYFILKELNRAIQLNFPHAKKEGIIVGFWIDIPTKLQETTPGERAAGVATADPN